MPEIDVDATGGLVPRPVEVRGTGGFLDRLPAGEVAVVELADGPGPGLPPRASWGVAPGPDGWGDEAYRVVVDDGGIRCEARTDAGAARALTTASQLLELPGPPARQVIEDHPRFAWRGLMVDVARSFRTTAELRSLVDLCALYKLNVLHLHLTDDEAWRIEIPGRPELTAAPSTTDGAYTVDEYRELQRYAAARFVTVVPELDLPGHCKAVRRAYPSLAGGDRPAGSEGLLPFSPPLDLRDPEVDGLVADIVAAVCAMTTGRFVHVGGDEVLGLDAAGFAVAVDRIREVVRRCGKEPVGWQEVSRAGLRAGDVVQYWVDLSIIDLPASEEEFAERSDLVDLGVTWELMAAVRDFFAETDGDVGRILGGGGRVLLSPQSHLYLDRPYRRRVAPPDQQEAAARLGFPSYRRTDLATAFGWDPAGCGVPLASVAGVEATLFGESVRSLDDATTLLLPRLLMAAEAGWSPGPVGWPAWRERLAVQAPLWRTRGWRSFASTEVDWR